MTDLLASASGHGGPEAQLVLWLALILLLAKLGGDLMARLHQPAVLGELLAGVVLGNLHLVGIDVFSGLAEDPHLGMLAQLGILLLLFEIGLESTVGQMLRVGPSSLIVAGLGVLAPFLLGWLISALLLPGAGAAVHAFLGATLGATSVGITARVLKDLDRQNTAEARIILGAAVIDDVLGLIILAVTSGAIAAYAAGGALSYAAIAVIVGKSTLFLVGALPLGLFLSPRLFYLASRLRARGVLLSVGLAFCFLLSYLSGLIGLAPIVGAFAAGLILEDVHFRDFVDRGEHGLEDLVRPISSFLTPVFFVLMGLRTDLASFTRPGALLLSAALIAVGIAGKLLCGLGVLQRGVDRLSVGIGMIPRGEVGLIFANIGAGLTLNGAPVVGRATFAAVVIMVIVTTLITPPLLTLRMGRRGTRAEAVPPPAP